MATAIQQTLFGPPEEAYVHTGAPEPNPCRRLFGPGPEGKTCRTCTHLYTKQLSGRYLKCRQRKNSNCSASDHRARWFACAKYEERES